MKNLSEDIKESFEKIWKRIFANRSELLGDRQIAEHFFIAGYKAAIAERAKFDEKSGLIVKDLGEL